MHQFKNILYVINADPGTLNIARAVELAGRSRAKLTLLDVVDKLPTWAGGRVERFEWDKLHEADMQVRKQRLEDAAAPHRDGLVIETLVLEGKRTIEAIRQVLQHGFDLVMKDTSAQKGLIPRVFATEDMHLMRNCPCPVLLTKHDGKEKFEHILAAVAFDDMNDLTAPTPNNTLNTQILDKAFTFAAAQGSDLDIMHAYQVMGEGLMLSGRSGMNRAEMAAYFEKARTECEQTVSNLLDMAKTRLGDALFGSVKHEVHLAKGHPAYIIPEQAKALKTDLIVMGTVGRTGIPGFIIGNTAETILNNIDCSVLALKPEGFESPVTLP